MSKNIYLGANVELSTDTFASFIDKTNLIIDDMGKVVVTTAPVAQANTTNGGMTTGNAHIQGVLSALQMSAVELRGGTMSVPAPLIIGTSLVFANTNVIDIGTNAVRLRNIYSVNAIFTALSSNTGNIVALTSNTATITTLTANNATVNGTLTSNNNVFKAMTSNTGNIVALTANTGNIVSVSANSVSANSATIVTATITNANANVVSANTATITTATVTTANANVVNANTATIVTVNADTVSANTGNIKAIVANTLTSNTATITTATITNANANVVSANTATIVTVNANNVSANTATAVSVNATNVSANTVSANVVNANTATIVSVNANNVSANSATITTATITNANANTVSANTGNIKAVVANTLTSNTATITTATVTTANANVVNANTATIVSVNANNVSANTLSVVSGLFNSANVTGDFRVTGNLTVEGITSIAGNTAFSVNNSIVEFMTVQQSLTVNGNTIIGVDSTQNLNVNASTFLASNVMPTSNNALNLGSSLKRFGDVYANRILVSNVVATALSGNGSALTSLNASNIASGTIADARLPTSLAGKTFTTTATFNSSINVATTSQGGIEIGRTDGTASSPYIDFHTTANTVDYNVRLAASGGTVNGNGTLNIITGTNQLLSNNNMIWHAGNVGAGSGLDADLLDGQEGSYYSDLTNATGTLADARLPATMTGKTFTSTILMTNAAPIFQMRETDQTPVKDWFMVVDSGNWSIRENTTGNTRLSINAGTAVTSLKMDGATVWTAANDGASSGLDADLLDGQEGSYYLNVGNATGTLADARLPGTMSGKTFSSAIQINPASGNANFYLRENNITRGIIFTDIAGDRLFFRKYSTTGTAEGEISINGNGATDLKYNGATVWTAVNDGVGSGMDADLLDGQQGSYYLNVSNATGTLADARLPATMAGKTFSSNSVFQSGISVGTNDGNGIELGRTNGTAASTYIDFHTSANTVDYNARIVASGNVGLGLGTIEITAGSLTRNGQTVWDAGNGGAGSGMDADLLDGQQGSYYLNVGNATGTLADARLPATMAGKKFTSLTEVVGFNYVSGGDYFRITPSDYGAGKHGLFFARVANTSSWNVSLWDGTNNNGTINFNVSNLNHNGQSLATKSYVDTAAANAGSNRVAKTGDAMTGNLTIQKAYPLIEYRGTGTDKWWSYYDTGDSMFKLSYNESVRFQINASTGSLWTAHFGDVHDRIENRALAFANDRVANLFNRTAARTEIYLGTNTFHDVPDGAVVTGVYVSGTQTLQRIAYKYIQLYDPVRGWQTAFGG